MTNGSNKPVDIHRKKAAEGMVRAKPSFREILLVACNRSKTPKADTLPYIEIVEEALCFGWIDSTLKKLPDGRLAQRLSPRRKGSHWTELNKERCRHLEAKGQMTDSGRKALTAI